MSTFTEVLIVLFLIAVFVAFIAVMRKLGKPTYMAQPQQFNPQADVTTVLPIPIHSATCDHDWETMMDQMLEMPHEKKVVLVMTCRRCGAIDKTVQITSPAPPEPPPPPMPPCLHDWQIVVEQNLDVAHEKKVVIVMTCRRCGEVDKTTETTSKAPAKEWPKSECRHQWETEKKVTLESAYEQMLKSITSKENFGRTTKVDTKQKLDLDLDKALPWMFRKSYVCVRICSACGEIDKIITSNFELAEGEDAPVNWPEDAIKIKKKRA